MHSHNNGKNSRHLLLIGFPNVQMELFFHNVRRNYNHTEIILLFHHKKIIIDNIIYLPFRNKFCCEGKISNKVAIFFNCKKILSSLELCYPLKENYLPRNWDFCFGNRFSGCTPHSKDQQSQH